MPFSTYLPEHMGSATLTPPGPFVAGSHAELTLVYTAGTFGIDDTGMLKISWRTTSDMASRSSTEPPAPNFTTVEASNGAKLEVWFDRLNIRPWANTLLIRVGRGYLRAGDTLTIRFGDRRQGSPGWRLQTNCRGARRAQDLGRRLRDLRILPSCRSSRRSIWCPGRRRAGRRSCRRSRSPGEPFRLAHRRRGHVGQPDRRGRRDARARAVAADARPARERRDQARRRAARDRESRRRRAGRRRAAPHGETGEELARANPLRVVAQRAAAALLGRPARPERRDHRHGLGRRLFPLRARQGLRRHRRPPGQRLPDHRRVLEGAQPADRRSSTSPGSFVCLPGYEWSGNTGMGGDRNIFYRREGRPIRRSSHILVEGQTSTDAIYTADELFDALARRGRRRHRPCRRALRRHAIRARRPARARRRGAFDLGHVRVAAARRVRARAIASASSATATTTRAGPGATRPGASTFGAIGGLTCYFMPELTRDALFEALRQRRHYGTTGTRLFIDLRGTFDRAGDRLLGRSAARARAGACRCARR